MTNSNFEWPIAMEGEQLTEFGTSRKIDSSSRKIAQKCDELKNLLISKNLKYGDSALKPSRIFSTSDSVEQIKVRIDDKLNRIKQGGTFIIDDEDTVMDLAGYLILLRIALEA